VPFTKVGRNKFVSPAGNEFTRKQVGLWYAGGGRFPGQKMGENFSHNSPTAPGKAARPQLASSGSANARSAVPMSIQHGTKSYFAPLKYQGERTRSQEFFPSKRRK